jgi:aminoglycoside phosphotransferase family enzyme/predicted kinase
VTTGKCPDHPDPEPGAQPLGATLIRSLCDPSVYDHPVGKVRVVETHISWVVLTGSHAYKIKKPVALGFLDFSTLDKRKAMCKEELRLNKRLAPELYLDVVAITGTVANPVLGGAGTVIEYAVRMVQFDAENEMDVLVKQGLPTGLVDDLAVEVADFHMNRARSSGNREYSTAVQVRHRIKDNFAVLRPELGHRAACGLDRLETWVDARLGDLAATMERRRADGYVRECHGDLHLGNMVLIGDRVRLFDCLEFNQQMRWIDVMSEVAFVVMDFDYHGRSEYGRRFLNTYLSSTGDYAGLELLRLYLVYRAMVRAKVACIRNLQSAGEESLTAEIDSHLALALQYVDVPRPRLVITHGFSGSGKSWWSERLAPGLSAVHLRSDVERVRTTISDSDGGSTSERYSPRNIALNYEHLSNVAGLVLKAGYTVIVDATFLKYGHRKIFYELAAKYGVEIAVLDLRCDQTLLRSRIQRRLAEGNDPSEATMLVLEKQLQEAEPLLGAEIAMAVIVESEEKTGIETILARISGIS